jgi:hypothetical protein
MKKGFKVVKDVGKLGGKPVSVLPLFLFICLPLCRVLSLTPLTPA